MTEPITERRCQGTNADGTPCNAPSRLVLDSGFCFPHDNSPGAKEKQRLGQQLGGIMAMRKVRKGLDPDEVGQLETAEDAKRIAALVTVAIAEGRLPAATGKAVFSGIDLFYESLEADELIAELKRTKDELAHLKRERSR